ncbi:MAG: glycosyltransferase family 61 protein [Alphaproteobacteria bacterium]|nr:glycosyltransferase family 61 protein [Alphaproteobacteria bacterium]
MLPLHLSIPSERGPETIREYVPPPPFDAPPPRGFPEQSSYPPQLASESQTPDAQRYGLYRIDNGFANGGGFVFSSNFNPQPALVHRPQHALLEDKKIAKTVIKCGYLKASTKIPAFGGTVVSLASRLQNNYYHWMLEILCGYRLATEEIGTPDHVYAQVKNGFQRDSLEALGVDFDKLISTDDEPIIRAEKLISPIFHHAPGRHYSAGHIAWLRDRFLPLGQGDGTSPLRIYLSRANAHARRLLNEAELTSILSQRGFTIIDLAQCSLAEQVSLFSRAEAVVSPHGAALTNLAFVPTGCKVVELFNGARPDMYYNLATVVGADYAYAHGDNYATESKLHDDFVVPADALVAALTHLNL